MKKELEEKKKIVLENARKNTKHFWSDFKDFAIKGNVVDLATGMIIGSAFTSIVNSLVKDILTPLIGALTNGLDFSELFISLDGNHYDSLADAQEAGAAILSYVNFITAIINFLIVALVIFIVFKRILSPKKVTNEDPTITEKTCPFCQSTIHIAATRCPHCTSELEQNSLS